VCESESDYAWVEDSMRLLMLKKAGYGKTVNAWVIPNLELTHRKCSL